MDRETHPLVAPPGAPMPLPADAHGPLPPEQIAFSLAQVEHSAAFKPSARHRALLRHLVTRWLAGDLTSLKESVIAVEVFGRPPARFDPRLDTIVRVETRRLRVRLANYYRSEGRDAPLRIELPVGSYIPLVQQRTAPQHDSGATRRARDLVERGEHFLRQALSRDTLEQAIARFDAALRESPAHAPACVGLGRAWFNLAVGWYHPPAVAGAHAGEALRRALVLDPGHAVAHVLVGAIAHQFEHRWVVAERSFRRALALAPQQAFVHSAYGCHLWMHGAFDAAERELLLARTLDPHYINTRNHLVNLRIAQRRLDDAEAEILAMQDIAPQTLAISGLAGAIALYRGDPDTAITHYQRCCELAPEHAGCHTVLAAALAMAGHHDQADALLAQTLQRFADRPISPYTLAIFETRRGRPDAAFALLDRALRELDPYAMQMPHEPSFEGLHADPRWAALLARPALRR